MNHFPLTVLVGILLAVSMGCAISPQPITVYESPDLLVQSVYDSRAGAGHSHPADITSAQLAAILRGLRVHGRDPAGTFGLLADDRSISALSDREIAAIAPHLASGLAKASPLDLVTFHLTQRDNQGAPLITSGGLFQRNRRLYIILANARTSPSSLQYETTYEPNSRLNPLLPITRFKFTTGFMPADWRVRTSDAKRMDGWAGYLDESKVVVIDLSQLTTR